MLKNTSVIIALVLLICYNCIAGEKPADLKPTTQTIATTKSRINKLNDISTLAANSILLKNLTPNLSNIKNQLTTAEQLYRQKKLTELKEQLTRLNKELDSANEQFLSGVLDKISPTPVYKKPTRTIIINPYMAIATIEQHDKLKINTVIHPMPTSQNARYHSWLDYGRPNVLGQIEISTDSLMQKISTAMGLDYNLSLTSIDYDPLVTSARYIDGSVDFEILDGPGILISSKGYSMFVNFDKTNAKFKNGFCYKSKKAGNLEVFAGIIFDSKNVQEQLIRNNQIKCKNCIIFWADTLEDLTAKSNEFSDINKIKYQTAKWIETHTNSFKLKGNPPSLIRQVEMSKRVLLSMQFVSGGIYAAPSGGYDQIWVRDTANAVVFPALCGDMQYLKRWTPYLMANPTSIDWKGKKYKSFLQYVPFDQKQSWQQDGTFYSILSAYSYWKLTGDDSRLEKWYSLAKGAIDFINDSAYDPEMELYYEWYINESGMKIAHDWESRLKQFPYISTMKINGIWPMYMCTIYLNNNMYNSFIMLAEMADKLSLKKDTDKFLQLADKLALSIDRHLYDKQNKRYVAGIAEMEKGEKIAVDWNYYDIYFDYVWAFTLHPQAANPKKAFESLDDMFNNKDGIFPGLDKKLSFSAARAHASYVYSAMGQFEKAQICLQRITERAEDININQPADVIYAMKGAIPEHISIVSGHRPQTFAAGPYLYGAASLAFLMDYHGITVCPSGYMSKAENICMKDSVFSIDTKFSKHVAGLIFDKEKIPHTLKLPSKYNKPGKHNIEILDADKPTNTILQYTCFELIDVKTKPGNIVYYLKGFGNGILRFGNSAGKQNFAVTDDNANKMDFTFWKKDNSSYIQVNAKGKFTVIVNRN
jgi:tetratricopeptide (TPR) repeat protein